MAGLPSIEITEYSPQGPIPRPVYLQSEIFYMSVDVPSSSGLTNVAAQAVNSLIDDGYTTGEAEEYVGLRIHAATSFAMSASSQQELQKKVIDTPEGPSIGSSILDSVTPTEAIDIAPFMAPVAPYEFNLEQWLSKAVDIPEDWEVTSPSLRWLELWKNATGDNFLGHLLGRCVEIEGHSGADKVAIYSGKIGRVLAEQPKVVEELLSSVEPHQKLALFGELGPTSGYIKDLGTRVNYEDADLVNGVYQVRHVDHFAGGCPKMDWWHTSNLYGEDELGLARHGDLTLVSVRGELVGSIKMIGEHSLLALRNIRDTGNKLPLVVGGVYVPRQEVVDAAQAAFQAQGKWARLDVGELALRPLRFLKVREAGELTNFRSTQERISKVFNQLVRNS